MGASLDEIGLEAVKIIDAMSTDRMPHDSNHKVEVTLKLLPGETVGPAPL